MKIYNSNLSKDEKIIKIKGINELSSLTDEDINVLFKKLDGIMTASKDNSIVKNTTPEIINGEYVLVDEDGNIYSPVISKPDKIRKLTKDNASAFIQFTTYNPISRCK